MHFEQRSAVQQTLRKITSELERLGIGYAVAGGMALFSHGLRRFTEDVDILVTREGLQAIHQQLDGRGYVPPFRGSKNLRDAEYGVRIEFLIAGEYPGDGKPKPVAFPEPDSVTVVQDGIRYLNLPALIELKLASGMTNSDRIKDLADVQELIKLFALPLVFQDALNPYVQGKYQELWRASTRTTRRYVLIWRGKPVYDALLTFSDLVLREPAAELIAMQEAGIWLDEERSRPENGYFVLVTQDADTAVRHEMHDEAEILYEE